MENDKQLVVVFVKFEELNWNASEASNRKILNTLTENTKTF